MAAPSLAAAGAVVIRHVHGVPSTTAAALWGGDPARPGRPLPPAACGRCGVIQHVHGVPSTTAAALWGGDRRGVPIYGGIVYCQRSILERSFIDQ